MTIHESLKKEIPDALRARDEVRLRTLRSLVSAMTNEVVAKKRKPDEMLTDEEALTVLKRAASERKDSIEQFTAGGRPELAEPEKLELAIIESYLPTQMSREQVEAVVRAKMAEMGIEGPAKTAESGSPLGDGSPGKPDAAQGAASKGKFIGAVMKDLKGQADGALVKEVVDTLLT